MCACCVYLCVYVWCMYQLFFMAVSVFTPASSSLMLSTTQCSVVEPNSLSFQDIISAWAGCFFFFFFLWCSLGPPSATKVCLEYIYLALTAVRTSFLKLFLFLILCLRQRGVYACNCFCLWRPETLDLLELEWYGAVGVRNLVPFTSELSLHCPFFTFVSYLVFYVFPKSHFCALVSSLDNGMHYPSVFLLTNVMLWSHCEYISTVRFWALQDNIGSHLVASFHCEE